MNPLSDKARFLIDRALLAGEERRAVQLYREDTGGGAGDARAYVRGRREALRAERPHLFRAEGQRPPYSSTASPKHSRHFRPLRWLAVAAVLFFFLRPWFAPLQRGVEQTLHADGPLAERLTDRVRAVGQGLDQASDVAPTSATGAPASRRSVLPAREPDPVSPTAVTGEAVRRVAVEPAAAAAPVPEIVPTEAPRGPLPLLTADGDGLTIDLYRDFRYLTRGSPLGLASAQSPLHLAAQRPAELGREPAYRGTPFYGRLPLGSGPHSRIVVALDAAGEPWRFYVDRNLNHDLSDDGPPVEKAPNGRGAAGVELDLNIPLKDEATTRPYRVWLFARYQEQRWRAAFYARCHYAARLRLGRGIYTAVAFEQRRHDGRFADDGLWIDLDRDGKLVPAEHFADGDRVTVDGHRYLLRLTYR
ncbi:hypothetical protein [Endothiovibrio diazotrophicus]